MASKKKPEGEPKDKPGPKEGMTDAERAVRDTDILMAANRGETYALIAEQHKLTIDQIGRIVRAGRADRRRVLDQDEMVDHVNTTLAMFEQIIADVAERMRDMKPEHHASFVGAMRLKLETITRRWEMLQAIGYVPQNLSTIRVQMEAMDVANDLVTLLESWEGRTVNDDLFAAVIEVLEGKAVPQKLIEGVATDVTTEEPVSA